MEMVHVNGPLHIPSPSPMSVTVIVKVYHCANGDGPIDGQIGFGIHSVHQCKFDGDGDEDGTL